MRSDVAVVVLAGGEGKRIGGGKPSKQLGGERLIDCALRLARSWSDTVAVAVRDPSQLADVQADLILDEDVPGPLGGLISGMKFASAEGREFLLVIPADMPFLPADLLERLRHALGDRSCALAHSGSHVHPVCSLWRAGALAQAQGYAASGRRSLNGLAASIGFVVVEWPTTPHERFFNVNTGDDLAEANRRQG